MTASFLKIGGELITDAILMKVDVRQKLNRHWWCKVVCRQTEDERFPIEKCLGQELQVLTQDASGNSVVVFDGFILHVELKYEIHGSYTARLVAVTRSYKMDLTPRQAYYLDHTLEAVASTLAGKSGLQSSVKGPQKRSLNYHQLGETDFSFLRRLADDYGSWIRPTKTGFEVLNEFQDTVELKWREEFGLIEFTSKGRLGQPAFNGNHYDFHQMESKTFSNVKDEATFFGSIGPMVDAVKTKSFELPAGYVHQRSRVVTLDEFETLLKKESVRAIGGNISGFGKSSEPKLMPGNKVNITGPLDAGGIYGITAVKHTWTPRGYTNTFWCTPWQTYTHPDPPVMRRWYGLVPGRVVENNDPKKMGRVQVQYVWQEDGQAYWARMVTPHAGSDRGFMFMPEVGDEVVIGFEDGDPERPIVLGCLWNGVDQAPRQQFWGSDIEPNDVKRIMTKSGHRVQFVDKPGKESIVLATPKHLKVSMIETTDETGRSMLTLHSENGDIFLSAPNGRIHLMSKYFSREIGDPATDVQAQAESLKRGT